MLKPRWRKVLRDVWSNKTRTALVVLSIAVGIFAIGMIGGSRVIMTRDLSGNWLALNPASATLNTDSFDEELVQAIRRMPAIGDAEARRTVSVRVQVGSGWQDMQIFAIPDFDDMRIYKINRKSGDWPPRERELLLERASLPFLSTSQGATIHVETIDGKQHLMRVGGVVHDPGQIPTTFMNRAYGYITLDTVEWLGESREFNQLNIVVAENKLDKTHIKAVADQVQDKIEKSGRSVYGTDIPDPGKHPVDETIQSFIMLLGVLGFFALLLSGFLVVNTIGALLTQQTRQIGVMKSIGARNGDIVRMYLAMVLIFGALSLMIAVPLGAFGARVFSDYWAMLFNFTITSYDVPSSVLMLQIVAGLLVPLIAALVPVFIGTRITVREAISGYGLGKGRFGRSVIDRMLERIHFLSRPLLLSLRNTFRRKARLMLTLTTLTLAGMIFMAVMSVSKSFDRTLEDIFAYYSVDVTVSTGKAYRTAVLDEVRLIPGVTKVEYWSGYNGRRMQNNEVTGDAITVISLPAKTELFHPKMTAGRWLMPEDANAIVVNTEVLKNDPDIKIGDMIRLKIEGKELDWRVVGIADILMHPRMAYVNQPYMARQVNEVGRSQQLRIVTDRHDAAYQTMIGQQVNALFKARGLEVSSTLTNADDRVQSGTGLHLVVVFMLIMAVLLAVVGGLGLMGTMSINVLERTREIGVMRAIGASDGAVLRIVLAEGILIGVISWAIGALLSLPASQLLSSAVEMAFQFDGVFTFSFIGPLMWLGIVLALAGLASFLPAWNASRVTVRDVLSYEG